LILTPHFDLSEFACKDGTPVPGVLVPTCTRLAFQLENVRPPDGLEVVSGYRSLAWNTKVGGAKESRHMRAEAADVRPVVRVAGVRVPWALVPNKRARIAALLGDVNRAVADGRAEFGGIGIYAGKWLHLDIRERPADGHIARWEGTGIGAEVTG
jgi:hypothetical protein